MSYKKLQIWQLARGLVIDIHKMTLQKLPKFEMYEEGRQIRKSIKTVKATIVEGYGRRKYKQDFIKFLIYALSSNDEYRISSIEHRVSSIEYRASSIEYRASSIEHRVSRIQYHLPYSNFVGNITISFRRKR